MKNGATIQANGTAERAETCPLCGSHISLAEYKRITRIGEARDKQLAEELGALAREKEELECRRAEITEAADAEAAAKLEVEASRAAREIARMRKGMAVAQQRAERDHKKEVERILRTLKHMKAQVAKADAKAKAGVARAETRASAEAATRARKAREAHQKDISVLRAELRLAEQRRQREAAGMRKTIAVLERKADDQNRRHFGEEGEQVVFDALRDAFADDKIERHGLAGDIVHRVVDGGRVIGCVVIECKNTKAFSSAYIRQAESAMRSHNTSFGIVATRAMPGRHQGMCVVDDVLVVEPAIVAEVMAVIRASMVTIARLRASDKGKESKGAAVLEYVRGADFTAAMKRLASKVAAVRKSLSRERSHHDGWWRAREQAYSSILRDLSGVGARLYEILAPPALKIANDNTSRAKGAAP